MMRTTVRWRNLARLGHTFWQRYDEGHASEQLERYAVVVYTTMDEAPLWDAADSGTVHDLDTGEIIPVNVSIG